VTSCWNEILEKKVSKFVFFLKKSTHTLQSNLHLEIYLNDMTISKVSAGDKMKKCYIPFEFQGLIEFPKFFIKF
jgi:hypothetical protein